MGGRGEDVGGCTWAFKQEQREEAALGSAAPLRSAKRRRRGRRGGGLEFDEWQRCRVAALRLKLEKKKKVRRQRRP